MVKRSETINRGFHGGNMLTLKIIWCRIGELFWGFVADISWKLAKLFEPDYERLEKILEERKHME